MGKLGILQNKVEKLEAIEQVIKETIKDKKRTFKLPYKIRGKAKTIFKKNKVIVQLLKSNRYVEYHIADIVQGFVKVKDRYYDARADCIYLEEKDRLPMLIVQEWNLEPIATKGYDEVRQAGKGTDPQQVIIRFMEQHKYIDTQKKGLSPKVLILILIGGAIVVYALSKGSLF